MPQTLRKPSGKQLTEQAYKSAKELIQRGQYQEARAMVYDMMRLHPEDTRSWVLQGMLQRAAKDFDHAIDSFSKALSLDDANWEALYQLGLIMIALQRDMQAVELFENVLRYQPTHEASLEQLYKILLRQRQFPKLLAATILAAQAYPDKFRYWERLRHAIECCPNAVLPLGFRPQVLEQAKQMTVLDGGLASVAAYMYFSADPSYAEWGNLFDAQGNIPPEKAAHLHALIAKLSDPLLLTIFERGIVTFPTFELYVRGVRFALLLTWQNQTLKADLLSAADFEALQKLALYFFRTEYVPEVTAREQEWLQQLQASLLQRCERGEGLNNTATLELLLWTMFQPLYNLPGIEHWSIAQDTPALNSVWRVTYQEFCMEQELRETMPRFGHFADETSQKVRAQYEESPYPRWDHLTPSKPTTPTKFLYQQLSNLPKLDLNFGDDAEILIAGCGTGRHSLQVRSSYTRASILNIDLSSASLAYAKRKAQELKLDNRMEFMQADILELEGLNRQFDIIESVGVLHHMQDPLEGWRVLYNLLRPGGLMRIGLYSKLARGDIIKAREEIAAQGYQDTIEDIRRYRRECVKNPALNFMRSPDFYTLSSFRDLAFHRSEQQFTIPQIQAAIDKFGLQFLGFLLNDSMLMCYREEYPQDMDFSDLSKWHSLEEKYPFLFFGMYQFWCYKPKI